MKKIRWDDIYGHKQQKIWLQKLFSGDMPHCLLLAGVDGIGKKMLAERLAQAFRCESEDVPCGLCRGCTDKIGPTVYYKNDRENLLSIDLIRELKSDLAKTDFREQERVVIIDNAQDLTVVVANSLLKILEEPKDKVVFILLANEAHWVLSTIRSRCLTIFFDKLPLEDTVDLTQGWTGDGLSSVLSSGQPALIGKMTGQSQVELVGKMISFWKILLADYWVRWEIVKKISCLEKEKIAGVLFFWEICLRNFLLWQEGRRERVWWLTEELSDWYKFINFDRGKIVKMLDNLGDLKNNVKRNIHFKTQLFNFLLQF